jgi:hypothetical protein
LVGGRQALCLNNRVAHHGMEDAGFGLAALHQIIQERDALLLGQFIQIG